MAEGFLSRLKSLHQPPEVVDFFRGLFREVGVVIDDTGEAFSAFLDGEEMAFREGVDDSSAEFVVHIRSEQLDRLLAEVTSGMLSEAEQYRVIRALFTPATQAMLKNPMMSSAMLRKLFRVESLAHVHLRSPDKDEEDACHTLIHADDQWIVVPGLVGEARRVFDLTVQDAIAFQKHAVEAVQEDSWKGWLSFARWYKNWRTTVSELV